MGVQPIPEDGDAAVLRDFRHQVRATPPLKAGEMETLLERSALGDAASQARLIAANLSTVLRLAEEREDRGLPLTDLVQEGSLGLVEAVATFRSDGPGDFKVFAEQKIGEQMDAAIAAETAAVRDAEQLVAAATDFERTELLLRKVLGRTATAAEIAEKLEWSVERTRYVAQVVADARRRQDEELLAFIDPDADVDGSSQDAE